MCIFPGNPQKMCIFSLAGIWALGVDDRRDTTAPIVLSEGVTQTARLMMAVTCVLQHMVLPIPYH